MNWKHLSYLKPKRIERLQSKLLRNFVKYQIPYHPYYAKLFKKTGIKPSDINTMEDLKKIPFTGKEDVLANPKDFILQPSKELLIRHAPKTKLLFKKRLVWEYKPVHMHFTTGRSSKPIPFLYTNYDIEKLKEAGSRMVDVFAITQDEIVVNAFPFSPHLGFWQVFYSTAKENLLAMHTGGGKILGTEKIVKAIEAMNANLIAAMPGYSYHLLKSAVKKKSNFSKIKHVILGGENVPPGLKKKLEEMLRELGAKNPKILSTYALTEAKVAWPECRHNSGYHLYPDMEFIEIIDKNGEAVSDGEKGEIVYTALDFRGSVVLRYRTGDISTITHEKCFCGRTVPRIGPKIERKSNIQKIKGSLVDFNSLTHLLMDSRKIDEWQLEIRKKNNDPYEVEELVLYVAPRKNISFNLLKKELIKDIGETTEVTPIVLKKSHKEMVDLLGLETNLKEKRIVDKRSKK